MRQPHYTIDINADLGEGTGFDIQLMPLISSCSIACGGHYGTEKTMRTTIQLAKKHGVKVGAHPSYQDRLNFGREVIEMTKEGLKKTIVDQLKTFHKICAAEEITVHHIKLHGALYNYAGIDPTTADAVLNAIEETELQAKLYVQHGSVLHKKAANVLPLLFEAFIDRAYQADGRLVPRNYPQAIIETAEKAWKQLYGMVSRGVVGCINGEEIPLVASTFCIHGDHPNSVPILNYINQQCKSHFIQVL